MLNRNEIRGSPDALINIQPNQNIDLFLAHLKMQDGSFYLGWFVLQQPFSSSGWQRLPLSYLTSLVSMVTSIQISWKGKRTWIVWKSLMHQWLIWHTSFPLTFCWLDLLHITTLDASEAGKCHLPSWKWLAVSAMFTILVKIFFCILLTHSTHLRPL